MFALKHNLLANILLMFMVEDRSNASSARITMIRLIQEAGTTRQLMIAVFTINLTRTILLSKENYAIHFAW